MNAEGPTSGASSKAAPETEIPDKLYFKIGEVADLVGVQTHVLRYWEKEIPAVRPTKSPSNQRRYRRRDVEIFREVRRLLYEERYTLAGAKKKLGLGGRIAAEEPITPPESPVAPKPEAIPKEGAKDELSLAYRRAPDDERLDRIKDGLKELIRMSGEDP